MILNSPYISGSSTITGNLLVLGNITGSTNSAISASYANNSTSASYALNATSASYALVATSASYSNNSTSASYSNNSTSASYALAATSASYALVTTSASYAANADLLDGRDSLTFANTGSNAFVGTQNINGSVAITGSLTTTGAITAQTLNVQQVTSSIVYSSGSNIFGNSVSNTQSMTGSVGISGSLSVNGVSTLSGALGGTSATFSGNVIFDTTDRGIVSNTSDGSDNKFVSINGGGARGSDRGGTINLFGNESTGTGRIDVNAGDVVGGVINLVTAGLNRLTVDRAGLVGIGTTSPTAILHLSSTGRVFQWSGATTGTQYFDGANTGANLVWGMEGSAGAILYTGSLPYAAVFGNETNYPVQFGTNNAIRMTITSGGNVGIGIDNPALMLHVQGPLLSNFVNMRAFDSASMAANVGGGLSFGGKYTTGGTYTDFAFIKGNKENGTSEDFAGYLNFYTRANGGSFTERMRITSGGLVGIGTSSPTTKLQVNAASATASSTVLTIYGSDTGFSGSNDANTAYSINFDGCSYSGASSVVQRTGAQIQMLKSGSWNEADGSPGTYGNLVFKTNNGTIASPSLSERMRITSGGLVGIGTSSPAYLLDINSTTSPATIGLKTDATYNSVFRDYIATTDSYLDITTERTDGGGFNFLLLVSSTLTASGANRNYYTFAVQGRGTAATATQLSNVTAGTSARTAIAVSYPSNGVIRLTLTGAETCQIKVTAIGHGSL